MKLDKLLKQKVSTDNKRNRKDNFEERVDNLIKITFTEDEQKLLEKSLRYAPPVSISR